MKVVLFEDDPSSSPKLVAAIKKHLPKSAVVVAFQPKPASVADAGKLYEERLAKAVVADEFDDATLWVTDRDLSRTDGYQGLSEAVVTKVASQLGVPLSKYARGAAADDVFDRQRNWGDAQIVLDPTSFDELGRKIAVLAEGFLSIEEKLKTISPKKRAADPKTPAEVMARILDHPDRADQIALYSSGDQKMVGEILPFAGNAARQGVLGKRLRALFGYWLYDSLLRFPGLFVNTVAAASYLNIGAREFQKDEIQRIFKSALYVGPFQDSDDPHWWRRDLDLMVKKAKVETGNELVTGKLGRKISPCLDSTDGKRAGWYCMVKKVPVSEANSVGNISWFPPGADLARIRKDVYEEMGPWLGLY